MPTDYVVDLDEVYRLLGLRKIRLAPETEAALLFPGCEVGAVPPIGKLFDMPVLVDVNIAATHRDVIHIRGTDFDRLVNPLIASFALRELV